jgi:hypothetical protein
MRPDAPTRRRWGGTSGGLGGAAARRGCSFEVVGPGHPAVPDMWSSPGGGVLVTKESRRQKDAEGGEQPASQEIGSIVVAEVQCRNDHQGDRRQGPPGQAWCESKHVVDADQGRGDVAAGEGVTLESLQGVEEVPDRFGDEETGEFLSVRGRQGESGPERRDNHVAGECEIV